MKCWMSVGTMVLFLMSTGQSVAADKLSGAASKLHAGVQNVLRGIEKDIRSAAKETGKLGIGNEPELRKILRGLYGNRPYVIDTAFIDSKGVMKIIEPEQYKKYEGFDISKQEAVIQMLKVRKPRMGNVFDSVEGIKSIDIEYPIFSGNKKEVLGSVSVLIKQAELVRIVAAPIEKKLGVNCWVMQKDSVIVYETDPTQLGLNIFRDPLYQKYPELISLTKKMVKEKTGNGFYTFLIHGSDKVVKKEAAWKTINFFNNQWIVVAYREVE